MGRGSTDVVAEETGGYQHKSEPLRNRCMGESEGRGKWTWGGFIIHVPSKGST